MENIISNLSFLKQSDIVKNSKIKIIDIILLLESDIYLLKHPFIDNQTIILKFDIQTQQVNCYDTNVPKIKNTNQILNIFKKTSGFKIAITQEQLNNLISHSLVLRKHILDLIDLDYCLEYC